MRVNFMKKSKLLLPLSSSCATRVWTVPTMMIMMIMMMMVEVIVIITNIVMLVMMMTSGLPLAMLPSMMSRSAI